MATTFHVYLDALYNMHGNDAASTQQVFAGLLTGAAPGCIAYKYSCEQLHVCLLGLQC